MTTAPLPVEPRPRSGCGGSRLFQRRQGGRGNPHGSRRRNNNSGRQ